MMSINLNHNAILNIKGADYYCIINRFGRSEAVSIMTNSDLAENTKVF